jgi:hypothetical protein
VYDSFNSKRHLLSRSALRVLRAHFELVWGRVDREEAQQTCVGLI